MLKNGVLGRAAVGAWIEIDGRSGNLAGLQSLPPWERGLKSQSQSHYPGNG